MANIIQVTDIDIPELEVFAKLTEVQLRNNLDPAMGIFIAESGKVIELALKAGCEPLAFLMEERYVEGQAKDILARYPEVPCYVGERQVLASLTGYTLTRGILCALRRPKPLALEQLVQGAQRLAVLDGITDATNVGAIFRSAAALNVDGVVVMENCNDPLCRRSVRVSMGTIFQVPWCRLKDLTELKKHGFKLAAMALTDDSVSIEDERLAEEEKLALVFGSEGYGLSKAVLATSDYTVKIPMSHEVDSLNVAAASAVAFWQLRKKYKRVVKDMDMKELIKNINRLAQKKRTEGLTEAEQTEQKELYKEYLGNIRGQVKAHLENVRIVDEDGNEVKPTKKAAKTSNAVEAKQENNVVEINLDDRTKFLH